MEKHLQLWYVDAQFTVLQASHGAKYFTIQGSSTKISDGVSEHKQFALIAVDSHGNKYVYKLYVTGQHLKFATDLLTPVTRRYRASMIGIKQLSKTNKSDRGGFHSNHSLRANTASRL